MQFNRSMKPGEAVDAPVHPQDFPRIARELGFNFTLRRGRVDWQKIDSINIDRLVQECDLTTLHNNLTNVVNYNLDREYDVKILDENFVKLFKLAQLSIDYLLYSEQHLFCCIDVLYKENTELKNELSAKENFQQNHQSKIKRRKQNGNQQITPLETEDYFKCQHCAKTFLSGNYLSGHILRRHPGITVPDQGVDTNALISEINELKARLKVAEQFKYENQNKPDVSSTLKDWQVNLQAQYREEMLAMKNMFVNEIKHLKETKSEADHLPSQENKVLLEKIQKQEQELNTIREQIEDKSRVSPEVETLRGQLEAQEQYWKSRMNEAQSNHTKEIAELRAQLSELNKSNETQTTLQELLNHTKEQDKQLAFQSEQISKITHQQPGVKSNNFVSTSTLSENYLINLEEDLPATDKISILSSKTNSSEVPSAVPPPKTFHQPAAEPAELSRQDDLNRNLQLLVQRSSSKPFLKPQDLHVHAEITKSSEDNQTVVRDVSFSDSSISEIESGNAQKLNVHYFPTKVLHAKTAEEKNTPVASRKQEVASPLAPALRYNERSMTSSFKQETAHPRNIVVPAKNKHSNAAPKKQELVPTTSDKTNQHQRTDVSEPKTKAHPKNSMPELPVSTGIEIRQRVEDLIVPEPLNSSSSSSEDSGSTITEESAAQDGPSEANMHTVASMEDTLAKNPQIFDNLKEYIVEQFENRLRELAIDPQWQGIPTANFNKNLATLQHHESITAKEFNSFFKVKQHLISSLDDRLGLEKETNSKSNHTKDNTLFKNTPDAKRAVVTEAIGKKNSTKKVPSRSPNMIPHRDQMTVMMDHRKNNDKITPLKPSSSSHIVTSTPLRDQDTEYSVPVRRQTLADGDKTNHKPTTLRLGSSDGNIDSLLNEPVRSPLRRLSSPVSKSQDFLDATPRTPREISPRSVLKGALSTGSLASKKRVVFSDQDEFNVSENRYSTNASNTVEQKSGKMYQGVTNSVVNQTDQDSFSDSDYDLSSNKEDDSMPTTRSKESVIKLSTQQSNTIAQISHSIETQLRDTSRLKPVGGIEAMFQGSSFSNGDKPKAADEAARRKPVPQPRKSDGDGAAASKLSSISDDWDLEDLDDLLSAE